MWTDRIATGATLAALMTPAAADYAHAPFHDRPFEVADIALRVLEGGSDVPVTEGDVPLAAAVAAFLLVSELGLAETFEEAVEGEEDDDGDADDDATGDSYAAAYRLLQTVRPWIAAVPSNPEIEDLVDRLDALMPTEERPEKLDADPEAGEVVAQALVGQLESAANADLYLGRDLARALDTIAELALEGCRQDTADQPRWFEVAAIYFEDALEAPLSVMAAEEAERIENGLEALQQGQLSACETIGRAFDDADRRLFP